MSQVPAQVIPHDRDGYATGLPPGGIVAARCRQAGIPLVTLGLVDDASPNAFTFGRTRRSAHVWVSRGLLERLDERELEAVVTTRSATSSTGISCWPACSSASTLARSAACRSRSAAA